MRKISIICLWVYIIFLVLSCIFGGIAAILNFVAGEFMRGFSGLFMACVCVWVLAATVGVKVNEKE